MAMRIPKKIAHKNEHSTCAKEDQAVKETDHRFWNGGQDNVQNQLQKIPEWTKSFILTSNYFYWYTTKQYLK